MEIALSVTRKAKLLMPDTDKTLSEKLTVNNPVVLRRRVSELLMALASRAVHRGASGNYYCDVCHESADQPEELKHKDTCVLRGSYV